MAMNACLRAISAFQLTSGSPDELQRFYIRGIGFSVIERAAISTQDMALLGLAGRGSRVTLRLGKQVLQLDSFERPGRPYPQEIAACDLRFQHFAIVTQDAAFAWRRAREYGATPISTDGPVTLPPASGGVTAMKFRDPEGHPLEFLQFPTHAAAEWRGEGNLGIDHSALAVADARASRRFYERLGLVAGPSNINRGTEQQLLDGLADADVEIVPLAPSQAAPHLELLGYKFPIAPADPRPLEPNDIASTRIVWAADRAALIRDPDQHLHVLRCQSPNASWG